MYYDDRYGEDVLCRRNGRDRRVTPSLIPRYRDPRSGEDRRRRGVFRTGVVEPLAFGLALIAGGTVLGYFLALAATTTYLP